MATGEREEGKRFLLLYGSQTGQAKAIAEQIHELAAERGLEPDTHCFSKSEKEFDLTKEPVVVIVVSTTGDGEAPDTVSKFWRKLKKKTVPETHLSKVQYGLLGLGDSNYNNFCNMGKNLHRRMRELGATPFVEPGWADDGVGLELVVEPWIEDLWEPLEATLEQLNSPSNARNTPLVPEQNKGIESSTATRAISDDAVMCPPVDKITEPTTSVNSEFTDPMGSSSTTDKFTEPVTSVNSEFTDPVSQPSTVGKITEPAKSVNSEFTNTTQAPTAIQPSVSNTVIATAPETAEGHDMELTDFERELKRVKFGSEPLSLPSIPPPSLSVKIEKTSLNGAEFRYNDVKYTYSQTGGVTMATVVGCRQLTGEGALRTTIEIELCVQSGDFSCEPGDAVSFVCPNPWDEVELLLDRLGLMSCADHMIQLELNNAQSSTAKNSVLPRHIPPLCSVHQFFTHCADFRAISKKVMLAYLSSCCGDQDDKRRLAELSSRENASQYRDLVLGRHVDLLDILFTFPSCQPSLDGLIQLLPRLKPRLYSIASSPLASSNHIRIALSVLSLPLRSWWTRKHNTPTEERRGLASGYIYSLARNISLGAEKILTVPLAPRGVNNFHLPEDSSAPLVMIGPGTGVAPFLGFLEHRRSQYRNGTASIGRAWLFFGCRHPDLDYIYKDELREFVRDGTLAKLTVCFSRLEEARSSEGGGRYVQDGMRRHAAELAEWVLEDGACIYVCGEARGMVRDVEATWDAIFSEHQRGVAGGGEEGGGKEENATVKDEEGEKTVQKLKDNSRYLVDAWTG